MEFDFFMNVKRAWCDSFYPFKTLSRHSFESTGDGVFDYMLNIRNLNEGIDQKRKELLFL